MMAKAIVVNPGLYSCVQDYGRFGFREFGVPVSGPMDQFSFELANLLLRNPVEASVLEITQTGPTLRFQEQTTIAISGAELSPKINAVPVENNQPLFVNPGDVLSFESRQIGNRAYLGIRGGFLSPTVLGSRCWYPGITDAVRLEKGMELPYRASETTPSPNHVTIKVAKHISSREISCFPGPEYQDLTPHQQKLLTEQVYHVGRVNNRMGIQLEQELKNSLSPIVTGPVIPGTVQLTPGGKLIILMKDGQTTGGYPRILQLSELGIATLAQKLPGEGVQFKIQQL